MSKGDDEDAEVEMAYIRMEPAVRGTKLRISASKVASLVGLHEYAKPVDDFLEYLYQDLDELLLLDASVVGMEVTTKDEQLHALMEKSGATSALVEVVKWSKETKTTAKVSTANTVASTARKHIEKARKQNRLTRDEARELQDGLTAKVRQSVGKRNENLALKKYEAMQGTRVESTNDKFYFLLFPDRKQAKALVPTASACPCQNAKAIDACTDRVEVFKGAEEQDLPVHHFSICGMIDGVTEALVIHEGEDDDEWATETILVEVKNRMGRFRDPVPLHDCIQMAVYMKMINVTKGDMVQCLHHDKTTIQVSRVSLDSYPLVSQVPLCACKCTTDLWTSLIVPRLYLYVEAVNKFRQEHLRRLAFLQAPPDSQLKMLRDTLPFL